MARIVCNGKNGTSYHGVRNRSLDKILSLAASLAEIGTVSFEDVPEVRFRLMRTVNGKPESYRVFGKPITWTNYTGITDASVWALVETTLNPEEEAWVEEVRGAGFCYCTMYGTCEPCRNEIASGYYPQSDI